MQLKSLLLTACGIGLCAASLCATSLSAQTQHPSTPWRGAGAVPCVGSDGGVEACAPPPRALAIRAGHLFDSKSGNMLAGQVILLFGDRITAVDALILRAEATAGS